jgi:P27 family predicted phage terminase small subunit
MPAAIRIAKGTHLERLNRNEPKPPADSVVPPPWLEGDALDKWNEVAAQLLALGILTNIDVDALSRYCVTWQEWRKHLAICQKGGDVLVLRSESGAVRFASVAPSATLVGKYGRELLRLAQEFGLTPSSRSTIVGSAVRPEADPLQTFLAKHDARA